GHADVAGAAVDGQSQAGLAPRQGPEPDGAIAARGNQPGSRRGLHGGDGGAGGGPDFITELARFPVPEAPAAISRAGDAGLAVGRKGGGGDWRAVPTGQFAERPGIIAVEVPEPALTLGVAGEAPVPYGGGRRAGNGADRGGMPQDTGTV